MTTDGDIPAWVQRPNGLLVMDAWTEENIPVANVAERPRRDDAQLIPPTTGVCVRIAVFPPDDQVDAEALSAYEAQAATLYGSGNDDARGGMHRTDTVDVVTVISGEIWALLDAEEVLLRQGDVLVQRATRHAWSNRSTAPCTVVTTMIPADRSPSLR